MDIIITCIIALPAVVLGLYVLSWQIDLDGYEDCTKIKFDSFTKFYAVNPNRWTLSNCTVTYTKSSFADFVRFRFSLIDQIRYDFWHRRMNKQKTDFNNAKKYQEVLECITKDIQRQKEKAVEDTYFQMQKLREQSPVLDEMHKECIKDKIKIIKM